MCWVLPRAYHLTVTQHVGMSSPSTGIIKKVCIDPRDGCWVCGKITICSFEAAGSPPEPTESFIQNNRQMNFSPAYLHSIPPSSLEDTGLTFEPQALVSASPSCCFWCGLRSLGITPLSQQRQEGNECVLRTELSLLQRDREGRAKSVSCKWKLLTGWEDCLYRYQEQPGRGLLHLLCGGASGPALSPPSPPSPPLQCSVNPSCSRFLVLQ